MNRNINGEFLTQMVMNDKHYQAMSALNDNPECQGTGWHYCGKKIDNIRDYFPEI